ASVNPDRSTATNAATADTVDDPRVGASSSAHVSANVRPLIETDLALTTVTSGPRTGGIEADVASTATADRCERLCDRDPDAHVAAGRRRSGADAGDQLRRVDEQEGDQEPDERDGHVDHGHGVDRLRGAHAGGEDGVVEGDDEGLRVRAGREERELEHGDGAH